MKLISYLALCMTLQAEAKKKKGASGKRKRNAAPALCNKVIFENGVPAGLENNFYESGSVTQNNFNMNQIMRGDEDSRPVAKKRDCICANGFKKKKNKIPNPEDPNDTISVFNCDRPNISGVLKAKKLKDENNPDNSCFEGVRQQLNVLFSDDVNAREEPKLNKAAKTLTFDQAKEVLNGGDVHIPLNCNGYQIPKLHLVKKSDKSATVKFIIPYVVTDVDLSDNHIDSIHKEANPFHSLPWLRTANFKNNYLREIPTGIFKASEMLEEADFSFNQISELNHSNTFKKNAALVKLHLNNNMIHAVAKKSIMKLTQLEELYLNNNRLSSLKSKLLSKQTKLKKLDISYNNLAKVSSTAFSKMADLRIVKLNNNKIEYLTKKTFQLNVNLEEIDLSYNKIGYQNDRSLGQIKQNKLIHRQAFENNANVKKLHLNNNYINDLKSETFNGMTSLVEINLDHNQIEEIDANLFAKNPNLKFVFMRYNGITSVPSFDANKELKIAYLSHNAITQVTGLNNLEHLKRIDLGDNDFGELKNNALSGSTENLEFMYANAAYRSTKNHQIEQVGDDALDGATKLKVIEFADNKLTEGHIKFIPKVIDATADKDSLSIDLRRNDFEDARIGKFFSGSSELNELAAIVDQANSL
jgi:Leucine-rich repeat (LRR) protein